MKVRAEGGSPKKANEFFNKIMRDRRERSFKVEKNNCPLLTLETDRHGFIVNVDDVS